MRDFGRVKPETPKQHRMLVRVRKHEDPDVAIERPRKGGVLWMGQDEAAHATEEIVNAADRTGQLRSLIDAVRSNRVVDDFSPHWSFAREDFERKFYAKRSKVRISFVELKDTLPVQRGHCRVSRVREPQSRVESAGTYQEEGGRISELKLTLRSIG